MEIWGFMFLVILVVVGIPAIAGAVELSQNEKAEEQRYQELTTITKEEGEAIRQIMKQYKWKERYSPTYVAYPLGDSIDVNTKKIATSLATNLAKSFAVLNGLDENLIFKLYYMYNQANGEFCTENTIYSTRTVPAKRDILTGRITEGYTSRYADKILYHIKFFVLESIA